jgi:hypothetical protein
MTESKGPEDRDGTAVPGKKKRGSRIKKLRPYAFAVVAMGVVFGISAVIGAHVRAGKNDKVSAPANAVGPAVVPTGPADSALPTPTSTSTGSSTLFLPVHPSVPVTVTIYEDLRSPASKAFADEYAPVLSQLLTTGQAQIHYRLVTPTDKKYGGNGSLAAANAAACAQDQGRFTQFVDEVFKNQPAPQDDSLAKEAVLKKMAEKAKKIQMGKFEPCMQQSDHLGWVAKSQAEYATSGFGDVPVVQINDTTLKDVPTTLTPQKLRKLVLAEAKRVIAIQARPSASGAPSPSASSSASGSSSKTATTTKTG